MQRGLWGMLLAAWLGCGLVAPSMAAEPANLDGLLVGIEQGCAGNPTLTTLLQSLGTVSGQPPTVVPATQATLPPHLAESVGVPLRVAVNEDMFLLGVPVEGRWQGLNVTAITRTVSLSSPAGEFAIEVDGKPAEVEKILTHRLLFTAARAAGADGQWEKRLASFVDGINGESTTAVVCPVPF